ncbi:Heat shock protein 70 [Macrophomina phaseolina MS6]|uniref:Heat shock protein 70 n=1 Tax=Macrophomina phaseolina (strain MS6) TaxID=1126212 RepID=K2S0E5_MACPH|nr:Heat shock protein 70 [Macrophomina phaseolina MS6]
MFPRSRCAQAPWSLALLLCLLLSFCTCIAAQEPPRRRLVPGVGFSLAHDYGTASVHHANSTVANVVKIEGSPAYKQFMRGHSAASPHPQSALCPRLIASIPLLDAICQPSQLPSSGVDAAKPMVRALKASVEAYLGTTFCFADVAIPATLSADQNAAIRDALAADGLQTALPNPINAALAAAVANGIETDDERVLLAVDYSRSGLAAVLFTQELGVFDELRHDAWPELGDDSAPQDPRHWDLVSAALANFLRESDRRAGVDDLVSYGDRAEEKQFRDALRDVLGKAQGQAEAVMFDPIFASAAGVADASFNVMDDPGFSKKPFWSCGWRSALYRDSSEAEL